MNESSIRRRSGCATPRATGLLGGALGLFLVLSSAAPAYAFHADRLYFKHSGNIAIAVDAIGNLYTRNAFNGLTTDTGGLLIKRNGVTLYSVGPGDASWPERLGMFNLAIATGPAVFVPSLPTGTGGLVITNLDHGSPAMELDVGGNPLLKEDLADKFAYRSDFRYLTAQEQQNFIEAIWWVDGTLYPGVAGVANPADGYYNAMGGVSVWDKAAQIHKVLFTQIHGGQRFLPWHRQFLNWMEAELRKADPLVTLPYWDWTTNPVTDLPAIVGVGPGFPLGEADGRVGAPFTSLDNQGSWEGSYDQYCNGSDWTTWDQPNCWPSKPPVELDRHVKYWYPPTLYLNTEPEPDVWQGVIPDLQIIFQPTWEAMRADLESNAHDMGHSYLCDHGEVSGVTSPWDPMFWLLHTNADRLWASWQSVDPVNRMNTDPAGQAYGAEDELPDTELTGNVEPWNSGSGPQNNVPLRPWAPIPDMGYQQAVPYLSNAMLIPRWYQ